MNPVKQFLDELERRKITPKAQASTICSVAIGAMMTLGYDKQQALEILGRMWDQGEDLLSKTSGGLDNTDKKMN